MEVGKSCLWEPGAACSPVGGGATSSLLPVPVPSCLSPSQKQTSLAGPWQAGPLAYAQTFFKEKNRGSARSCRVYEDHSVRPGSCVRVASWTELS